jgi:MFS family permease
MSPTVLFVILLVCIFSIVTLRSIATRAISNDERFTSQESFIQAIYYASWVVGFIALAWIWGILDEMWGSPFEFATVLTIVVGLFVVFAFMGKWKREIKVIQTEWLEKQGVKTWEEYRWKQSNRLEPHSALEQRLQQISDNSLPIFDNMPRLEVWVVHEEIRSPYSYEENIFMKGLFRRTYNNNGGGTSLGYVLLSGGPICLKYDYVKNASTEDLYRIIKHELIHAWLHWKGLDYAHGPLFSRKALEVGAHDGKEEFWEDWVTMG